MKINYMFDDVISLKLITTEEVVAKFVEANNEVVIVDKPMVLSATPQGFTFIPFLITASKTFDTTITISKPVIMATSVTDKELVSNYFEATTGLKLM